MALAVGAISMIVVFISGMASGVVRVWTVALRCGLAFCVVSAASYFLLILLEMYYNRLQREAEQIAAEVAAESESENSTDTEEVQSANT